MAGTGMPIQATRGVPFSAIVFVFLVAGMLAGVYHLMREPAPTLTSGQIERIQTNEKDVLNTTNLKGAIIEFRGNNFGVVADYVISTAKAEGYPVMMTVVFPMLGSPHGKYTNFYVWSNDKSWMHLIHKITRPNDPDYPAAREKLLPVVKSPGT